MCQSGLHVKVCACSRDEPLDYPRLELWRPELEMWDLQAVGTFTPPSLEAEDLHSKELLPAAPGGHVRYWPVEPCYLQEAGNHPYGSPKRQTKEHFHIRQNWIAPLENTGRRRAIPCPCLARSAASRAASEHHCKTRSRSCGSGQARFLSCTRA